VLQVAGIAVIGSLTKEFLIERTALCRELGVQDKIALGLAFEWTEALFGALEEEVATGESLGSLLPEDGLDSTLVNAIAASRTTEYPAARLRRIEALIGAIAADLNDSQTWNLLGSLRSLPTWFEGYLAEAVRVEDIPKDHPSPIRVTLDRDLVTHNSSCATALLNVLEDDGGFGLEQACWHLFAARTGATPEVSLLHGVIPESLMMANTGLAGNSSSTIGRSSIRAQAKSPDSWRLQ